MTYQMDNYLLQWEKDIKILILECMYFIKDG